MIPRLYAIADAGDARGARHSAREFARGCAWAGVNLVQYRDKWGRRRRYCGGSGSSCGVLAEPIAADPE